MVKLPARVNSVAVGFGTGGVAVLAATRKKPGPCWIATSNVPPVDCSAPPVIWLSIEPSWTPRPIWAAFEPPVPPPGPEAPRCVWFRASVNVARADL